MNTTATPTAATTTHRLIDVLFDSDHLILVDHFGQPYVVMKPLVSVLGLAWQPQYEKLAAKFGAVITEIVTTGSDGKQYTMVCLPLRKLPAWLYSLNPGKLAPALRAKVVRYQEECDEVLWRHWTGTYVAQNHADNIALSRLHLDVVRQHSRLISQLVGCTSRGHALAVFALYSESCERLGLPVQPLEDLVPALRQQALPGV